MKTLGNIIWLIFGGLFIALGWLLTGLLLCITIIGIPFGLQCFKFAKVSLTPFGMEVILDFSKHPVMNTIWLIFFGWGMFLGHLVSALILMITIIGIPFGLQVLKMAKVSLIPFGAEVR